MDSVDRISDEQERRRLRLAAASADRFGGNETDFGRALGYKDGAFLRQMLTGRRPITEKTVAKVQALRGLAGWFDGSADAAAPMPAPAPVSGISARALQVALLFDHLDPEDQRYIERIANNFSDPRGPGRFNRQAEVLGHAPIEAPAQSPEKPDVSAPVAPSGGRGR